MRPALLLLRLLPALLLLAVPPLRAEESENIVVTGEAEPAAQPASPDTGPSAPDGDWTLHRVNGRDYVTLANIAQFYGFALATEGRSVTLSAEGRSSTFTPGGRDIRVDGAIHWLSYPVEQPPGAGETPLVSTLDLIRTLEPLLRPSLVPELTPIRTIVLDPGHGGRDLGAESTYGCEKDYALDVALKARDLLRAQGVPVLLTREDDTFIELQDRARLANDTPGSLLVSIHFNSADYGSEANGFEVYSLAPFGAPGTMDDVGTYRAAFGVNSPGHCCDRPGVLLATCLHHSLLAHMERADRGLKRQRFAVLRLTRRPSALVECGFLNNHAESAVVATEKWRERLANALVQGLLDYLRVASSGQPPRMIADYTGASRSRFRLQGDRLEPVSAQPRVNIPGRKKP